MKRVYLILIYLAIAYTSLGQVDAGPDKVICDGKKVEIGKTEDSKYCYFWTANPADPSLAGQEHIPKPKVNPSQTTVYTLTATGAEFSSLSKKDVKVMVIKLKNIVVKESAEPDAYFDEPELGGSIFITGNFTFKSVFDIDDPSVVLNWDLYDLDFINEKIAEGVGRDFTHLFSADNEDGDARVRFWHDANKNSLPDNDECVIESEFEVKEINTNTASVARASTTAALSAATVDGIFSAGTVMLKKKDRVDDFRCACEFKREGTIDVWNPTADMPDEVNSEADFDNINDNVSARIKVVRQITWCGGPASPGRVIVGCATVGSRNTVIVAEGRGADVWIHEIGHSLGLSHRPATATGLPADADNLMYPQALGTQRIIIKSECEKFEP